MLTDKQNSLWLSFQFSITLVFSLLILKLNISSYGKESFGVWIVLASLWGFSTALDFGFGTAIVKYVAEFKYEITKINKLLSSSFFVFLCFGLLIVVLGNFLGYFLYFSHEGIIDNKSTYLFRVVFIILSFSFYLQYLSLFFKAIVEGLSNFIFTSKLAVLQNSILLCGVVLINILKLNLIMLSVCYLFTSFIILVFYVLYFKIKINIYSINYKFFTLSEVKKLLGFSLSVQAMSIFNALIDPIVKIIISLYLNVSVVPAYEIARRFALSISGLFFSAFRIILPKTSILKSTSEIKAFIIDSISNYCKIGISYSGLTFGILSLPVILFISFVFEIKETVLIYLILSLPESINNFGYAIYNLLLGVGKVHLLALIQFNNLICSVICIIAGFSLFNNILGLLGYFISVIIGNVIMIIYLNKKWDISIREFLVQCKVYKLVILITMLVLAIVLLKMGFFSAYLIFSIVSFISIIIFGEDNLYYFNQFKQLIKQNIFD